MSNGTINQQIGFLKNDNGKLELIAWEPSDESTIANRIDLGMQGSARRIWILNNLLADEGLMAIPDRSARKRRGRRR